MIRSSDNWKLIVYPKIGKAQLFDLNRDPFELDNLIGSSDATVQMKRMELEAMLKEWRTEAGDPLL